MSRFLRNVFIFIGADRRLQSLSSARVRAPPRCEARGGVALLLSSEVEDPWRIPDPAACIGRSNPSGPRREPKAYGLRPVG